MKQRTDRQTDRDRDRARQILKGRQTDRDKGRQRSGTEAVISTETASKSIAVTKIHGIILINKCTLLQFSS